MGTITVDLYTDEIGKIPYEMHKRMSTQKKGAGTRLTKIPCKARYVGKVVKQRKGTSKIHSNVKEGFNKNEK